MARSMLCEHPQLTVHPVSPRNLALMSSQISRGSPRPVMSKYASSMDTGCTLALDLSSVL